MAERKRGGCLTLFLILMMIVNPLVSFYYLLSGSTLPDMLPGLTQTTVTILGLLGIVNLVSAIGVWQWKKWGMYGFVLVATLTFFINLSSADIGAAALGLVGALLMGLLVRPIWNRME